MTLAAPSTEIWVLGSLNLFTSSLLSFRENGMLFYLDDHALRALLNLCPVVVTGGTTAEDYDGGCHRTPAASDERGSLQACGASRRTRRQGEEGQIVAKAEL